MLAKLLVYPELNLRKATIENILREHSFKNPHPDLLFLDENEKLGVEAAKNIRSFLAFKPYQSKLKAVAIVKGEEMTIEAQNALLKTLEEPSESSLLILGVSTEDALLPTIISRCQLIHLKATKSKSANNHQKEIESLLKLSFEEKFKFIAELEDRENFLKDLTIYFQEKLHQNPYFSSYVQELIQAQIWASQNVNIRAILEYLMLKMPSGQK